MVNSISQTSNSRSNQGFTLIEMMIVVAIIAILASISYPAYRDYTIDAIRADAMTELNRIGNNIEAQKINYKRYDNIPLNTLYSNTNIEADGSVKHPSTGTQYYSISVVPINNATSPPTLNGEQWTLTATPIATTKMSSDGTLTLDHTGEKCRDTACGFSDEWRK